MIPNIPGPFDEVIAAGIASCLELYFIFRRRQISKDSEEYVEVMEIKKIPRRMIEKK